MPSFIKLALSTTRVSKITSLSLLCLFVPINAVSVQAIAKEPAQTSTKMVEAPSQRVTRLLATTRGICDAWASKNGSQSTASVISNLEEAFEWITFAQRPSSLAGAPETPLDDQAAAEFYAEVTTVVARFLQTKLNSPSETLEFRQQLLEILENEDAGELKHIKAIAFYRVATSHAAVGNIEAALDYIRQSESIALTEAFRRTHQYAYACQ